MLKTLLIIFIISAVIFLLSGCSVSGYSLRQDVKRVLRDDFNGELELVRAQTEHQAGVPLPSGRQRIWLYDHTNNHYLFFNFVDSEYTEYREAERGGTRKHQRDSRNTIRQKISQQRDDLNARAMMLRQAYDDAEPHIQQPFFVHFGHTDRYRYASVTHPDFDQYHPLFLNILMPDETEPFLAALDGLLPALQAHFTANPNSKVTFYPHRVRDEVKSFIESGYWVSSGPPDRILGSRPEEELWQSHASYLTGQSAVMPAPASQQQANYQQVTRSPNLQRLLRHQSKVNQLASQQSAALDLHNVTVESSSALGKDLRTRIDTVLTEQAIELPSRRVLYFLDKEDGDWVVRFYATEQGFTKPHYVIYTPASNEIEVTRLTNIDDVTESAG